MNKTAAAGQGQPARESNINAIVSYFESGIKAFGGPGELGIELEQIIVHDDMSPVSYSGEHGVAWVLRQLEADYPRTTTDEHESPARARRSPSSPRRRSSCPPAPSPISRPRETRSKGSRSAFPTCWSPRERRRWRSATIPPPRRARWSSSRSAATSS